MPLPFETFPLSWPLQVSTTMPSTSLLNDLLFERTAALAPSSSTVATGDAVTVDQLVPHHVRLTRTKDQSADTPTGPPSLASLY
jgi:hypothetical protein